MTDDVDLSTNIEAACNRLEERGFERGQDLWRDLRTVIAAARAIPELNASYNNLGMQALQLKSRCEQAEAAITRHAQVASKALAGREQAEARAAQEAEGRVQAEAKAERLEAALREYGQHKRACGGGLIQVIAIGEYTCGLCTCGLSAALGGEKP